MPRSGSLQLVYCVCWWVVSIPPPHTHPRSPSLTKRRPSGDYRYRPARHRVTMLWRDSTKLECRADPRSKWLNRIKRCLSSGSVVTRGFESRSDIFRLQTVLVELRYPTTFYREGGGVEGSWSRPSNFLH